MTGRRGWWLRRLVTLGCVALFSLTACEDDGTLVLVGPGFKGLRGVWTGFSQVSDAPAALSGLSQPTSTTFTFPVALELSHDNRFVLRTVSFPTSSGQLDGDRTCVGLFARQGRYIEFFPNDACRALPLHRYTIGGTLTALVLESVSGLGLGQPQTPAIRVIMTLDRAASFDIFKH